MLLHDKKRAAPQGRSTVAPDPFVAPEHELTLALIGTAYRRKAVEPRALELLDQVDFEHLASFLQWQSLLPLVGTRLEELAAERLPAAFRDRVERSVRAAGRVATLHLALTHRVVSALEGVGIPVVPLKGAFMAEDLFDHAGLRETNDVDVLVDRCDLEPALEALERDGWQLQGPEVAGALPNLHYVLEHSRPGLPRLELHWRIHWYETGFSSGLVARSRPFPDRGRRPTPPDELAALLLFYCRDGFIGLRYAADIAAWWDANGGALEPNALDRVLFAHPELAEALLTTVQVADMAAGLPRKRLTSFSPATTVRSDLAWRLADWTIGDSLDQVAANRTLIDWLLCPPDGQRAFLRRTLFPSRSIIRALYGLGEDANLKAILLQGTHGPKLLLRYLAAVWAVRGARRWAPIPAWAPRRAV